MKYYTTINELKTALGMSGFDSHFEALETYLSSKQIGNDKQLNLLFILDFFLLDADAYWLPSCKDPYKISDEGLKLGLKVASVIDKRICRQFALACSRRVQHLMKDNRAIELLDAVAKYLNEENEENIQKLKSAMLAGFEAFEEARIINNGSRNFPETNEINSVFAARSCAYYTGELIFAEGIEGTMASIVAGAACHASGVGSSKDASNARSHEYESQINLFREMCG